jgi:hypothetical protein
MQIGWPSCLASSNRPTLARITLRSVVIVRLLGKEGYREGSSPFAPHDSHTIQAALSDQRLANTQITTVSAALCPRQRRGGGAGVARIRQRWPAVRLLLRADSGFARESLMAWCENNAVDFLFRLARNTRLVDEIKAELAEAAEHSQQTGKSARRFKDFAWTTRDSWSRERRVVAKAEWTEGQANPRFVVTSLSREKHEARHLYEKLSCARGEMENRIKECQLDLYADLTSAKTMRANEWRSPMCCCAPCPTGQARGLKAHASASPTLSSPAPPAAPSASSC